MDARKFYRLVLLLSRRFREKRMREFYRTLRVESSTRIIDLGGWGGSWKAQAIRPQVLLLNLDGGGPRDSLPLIQANALRCPLADRSFDIVFSSSLIEHLGTWENQVQLAGEIRRLGKGYWVQTPNKWFPIEPHYITPLAQLVPRRFAWMLRWVTLWGWLLRPSPSQCRQNAEEIRLLGPREVAALFPDAVILRERFLGLTKSITAVKATATLTD
jgi:SAM-dependent methyltransferase